MVIYTDNRGAQAWTNGRSKPGFPWRILNRELIKAQIYYGCRITAKFVSTHAHKIADTLSREKLSSIPINLVPTPVEGNNEFLEYFSEFLKDNERHILNLAPVFEKE